MTPESLAQIFHQAFMAAFYLSAPLLLIGFVIGVVINLIQIATSLQDTTFSTVPRLGAFFAGLIFLMPWMLNKMSTYAVSILGDLGRYAK